MPPRAKFPRRDGPRQELMLKELEGRVFRVTPSEKPPTTTIEVDCYKALRTPGVLIADNTGMLARVDHGALLRSDSRLYLGFASPSDDSVIQLVTSLMAYHDTGAKDIHPLLNSFKMAQSGGLPGTHACLDLDFSTCELENVETAQLFQESISLVVRSAIRSFVQSYGTTFSLPTNNGLAGLPQDLDSFLPWLQKIPSMKLFVTVRNMQRILGRFLDAAMWERYYKEGGSTLDARLRTIRELVLDPLWAHLDENGVVRKLLLAGPFLLQPLIHPPDPAKFPSLPVFCDLSSDDSLHGYTPPQIRSLYTINRDKVSHEALKEVLTLCNSVVRPFIGSATYTPDSVDTVFRYIQKRLDQRKSVALRTIQERVCNKFVTIHRDRVLGALYPVLRMDASFLAVAEGLLQDRKLTRGHGPVFSLADLITASTPDQQASRLFLTGLLTKVQHEDEARPDYYKLAGGCARALLADAVSEAKKNRAEQRANARNIVNTFFTADNIAKVILEHYRNVPFDELPKDEPGFQADLAKILRVALRQYLGDAGFASDVQLEGWLKDNRRERCGARNLRFDIAIRLRGLGPDGEDILIILELKHFNLEDTKKATYAHLDKLNKNQNARARFVLDSQTAVDSSARFVKELRSILPKTLEEFSQKEATSMRGPDVAPPEKVPVHWHTPAGPRPCELPFPFSPEHIQCDYKEYPPKPYPSAPEPAPIPRVKTAVDVVRGAGDQAGLYGAAAKLGVADQLGHGQGFADARFTDLGAGKTVILCFSIVNIAGALVYVKFHSQQVLERRLAIVGTYPWSRDPTQAETKAMLDAKRDHDAKTRS